jgi:hypothetical protein
MAYACPKSAQSNSTKWTESRVLHVAHLRGGFSTTQPLHGDELRAVNAWLEERVRMKPTGKAFFVSAQRKPLHRSTVNLLLRKFSTAASMPLLAYPHKICQIIPKKLCQLIRKVTPLTTQFTGQEKAQNNFQSHSIPYLNFKILLA